MRDREVNQRIEARGGYIVRQKGSHRRYAVIYLDVDGITRTAFTTVQQHRGQEIPLGTLRAFEKDLVLALGEGWLLR